MNPRYPFAMILLAFFLLGTSSLDVSAEEMWYRVTWVVDGDTLILESGEHVRLLGINAPEKDEPCYRTSTEFLIRLAKRQKIRLEYDRERRDRYGRLLAYGYLKDGNSLNEAMLRAGWARVFNKYPFKKIDRFLSVEKEARERRLGIWRAW